MKINKIAFALLLAAAAFSAESCVLSFNLEKIKEKTAYDASGNIVRKDTLVNGFDSIETSSFADVTYYQKDSAAHVSIEASDNIIPLILVSSENGKLKLSIKESWFSNYGKIHISVYSKSLRNIETRGSGDFIANGVKADDLSFSSYGSGNLELSDLTCTDFSGSISGSGDMTLDGLSCGSFSVSVAGSGDVSAKKLKCDKAVVSVAGSGDISLDGFAKKADLQVAGSGDIFAKYLECPDFNAKAVGSGTVTKPGGKVEK